MVQDDMGSQGLFLLAGMIPVGSSMSQKSFMGLKMLSINVVPWICKVDGDPGMGPSRGSTDA